MSERPTMVDVVPLQQRRPSDLSPYFTSVARGWQKLGYEPPIGAEQLLDGRPYAGAPSLAGEVRHLLGLQEAVLSLLASGYAVTPYELRDLALREAAVCDRLALLAPDDVPAEATAIQAAWSLQCYDVQHRRFCAGEWQADAIHWPPLSDDPASGCRLYVRQEYRAWLARRERASA